VFRAKPAVAGTEWETLVTDIIRVNRTVLHRSAKTGLWSRTSEVAYYLANFSAPANRCGAAIRGHWHVENTLHYTRDVTFLEDESRIRCNPGVFARLRSFGYNILRRNKVSTFSQDRYASRLPSFFGHPDLAPIRADSLPDRGIWWMSVRHGYGIVGTARWRTAEGHPRVH
jgi:predicted transposase YbfD/YdcC